MGCNQPNKKAISKKAIGNKTDSLRAIKRREIEKKWLADSLKNEKVVTDVIAFIKTRQIKSFDKIIRIWKDTSISAYVKVGHLFSKKLKHIFIRTHAGWKLTIYVYRLDNLKREITDDWSDLTYIGDEIKDINGDGLKDLSINWYPSSGCCARNNFHIYLYTESDKFTKYFDFINPTFYPNES
ncbi:hypothetical protein FPZ43_07480 [Mucilaginibacter pallidiroseus]|uniref:Uncharacterized protein n=1 Tax=Mucilaginibacter pallidiroseus TaxID=2599295 RepID=A0A563UEB2_9SPHI|nr:hypothetical protein [Mucilaginibacter pallidiroseus]TWR29694.1 hypothetical protein FPZ43_07480 [Mucilaginibacter pallidiroseus]